jgi:hypothetical protein
MMVWSECHFHSTLQTTISHFTLPFPLAPLFDGTLFHFQTYLSSSLEYVGVLSTDFYDPSLDDYQFDRFSFLPHTSLWDSASTLV